MDNLVLKVAAKAVITDKDGKVLLLREASSYEEGTNIGRFDVPGGRLNPGESYNEGLLREVKEETGLEVEPLYPIYVGEWKPVIKGQPTHIFAIFTVCRALSGDVKLSEDHDKYIWVSPEELSEYDITQPGPDVVNRYAAWQKSGLPG
jgi:8-oxo-dGTP diphosphatase